MKTFVTPHTEGRHQPWTFFVTIAMVFWGMISLGNLPMQLALFSKGFSSDQIQKMSNTELRSWFTANEFFIYINAPYIVGFGLMLVAFRYIHKRSPISFMTLRPVFDIKRFLVGFTVWGILAGGWFLFGLYMDDTHLEWNFSWEYFPLLVLVSLFLVPLQAGLEELLFRGYLLQLFGRITSRGLLIVLSNGILFGALHLANPEIVNIGWIVMLFYVLSGCFTSLVALMDDGIELSWGFHTANNFIGILLVTSDWQVFRTEALYIDTSKPTFGWEMYVTLFVFYPLMVFIFAKRYKWTGWKQRLLGN